MPVCHGFGGWALSQIDQLWVLLCAALVFVMQAGFMCVEAGITRAKNNINVAIKNITDLSISILVFWLFGYGLMFGASQSGLAGSSNFLFGRLGADGEYAVFIFQAMFCGTAATILSGAVAERCAFYGYILITLITVALIYPLFGHWAWAALPDGTPAGWLNALGYHDFAGSGVVHAVGGGVALAAVLVIGARDGRFLTSGQARRFNGSNLPLTMLGVLLLWFGWFGFNGGSALGLTDQVPALLANTLASGAAGVLTSLAASAVVDGKPSVFYAMNGALGALVAITAGCDVLSIRDAVAVGIVSALIVFSGDKWLERMRVDDAVGAVPVHLFCGLWGILSVALLGAGQLGHPGGFLGQLAAQATGIAVLLGWSVLLPLALLIGLNRLVPLRVTHHVETIGLNVGEHGANTDLNELFEIMQRQARERDLSIRVPQSPFTEVGQIGLFYNSVMFELEQSAGRIQDKHDRMVEALEQKNALLESVLPKAVALRMNSGEDQIVDQFTDATVVFVDLVDFTAFSMEVPPTESMRLLRDLFGRYDEVITRYGLEKIKTIGDCYMYVSGIPDGPPEHCEIAVDAALDLLFETDQLGIRMGRDIKVRIGVHSGPLVAGVVGEFRFVYDLWGSTVNISSRIEEAGQPGKITVSQAVIDRIGDSFVYERVGRARLQGVGPTMLYAIEARRTRRPEVTRPAAQPA